MAEIGQPRVKLPDSVAKSEMFEIKTLISHPMENGRRQGAAGRLVPRRIINRFTCTAGGHEAFAVDLHPSMAANPYLAFRCRLEGTAELVFTWFDDDGGIYRVARTVEVAG
jgi:sulfur-oxidizing protein SoxZ